MGKSSPCKRLMLRDSGLAIHYVLEETTTGGRVVISSTNKDAVEAVHQFLIFQIQEHKTGDPLQVP
jgi:hypothetical protein